MKCSMVSRRYASVRSRIILSNCIRDDAVTKLCIALHNSFVPIARAKGNENIAI